MSALSSVLPSLESEGNLIRDTWDRLHPLPGGDFLFHLALGALVPYTGSLGARVREVRPGYAKVELVERRAIRNHLRSIHAVALANLVELTGNIGVAYALPDDARFIVQGIRMRYHKKSRGRITGEASPPVPTTNERQQFEVHVVVKDEAGELVCEGWLDTLVGPKRS